MSRLHELLPKLQIKGEGAETGRRGGLPVGNAEKIRLAVADCGALSCFWL